MMRYCTAYFLPSTIATCDKVVCLRQLRCTITVIGPAPPFVFRVLYIGCLSVHLMLWFLGHLQEEAPKEEDDEEKIEEVKEEDETKEKKKKKVC